MATQQGAPQTLVALQQWLQQQGGELGARTRRVLTLMLESPQRVAVSTISQLAEELAVNASTLTRLAKRLGYQGFNDLQAVFRRELTEGRHFYSDQANLLNRGSEDERLHTFTRLARQESANLSTLAEQLDATALHYCAERLATAAQVRCHGVRQMASVASFVAYALGLLRQGVALLDGAQQGVGQGLAQLQAGDVLLVVSCFPYSRSVIRTAEVAVAQGIEVIAFTDSASSPLASLASHYFIVPMQSLFYSNSMAALMLLAQGLLAETAQVLGPQGVANLRQREALIEQLQTVL